MFTNDSTIAEALLTTTSEAGFTATIKDQFTAFFQNKGFTCAADPLQQLKATYKKWTVRFSVSDPKIASDQGHAVCYLSFAPLNKRYKIAIGNIQETSNGTGACTYTLLEDTFAKTKSFQQNSITFYSFEELLEAVFPKAAFLTGSVALQSFFSFLF